MQWTAAGAGQRARAGLVTIFGVGVTALVASGVVGGIFFGPDPHGHFSRPQTLVGALTGAILLLGPLVYTVAVWRRGTSLGMGALHLRLVDARSGDLPATEQVLLRMAGTFYAVLPAGELGVRRHVRLRDLGLRLPHWPWLVAALPALVVAWIAAGVLGAIGTALLPTSPNNQCRTILSDYGSGLALGLIAIAVVAPVAEEIVFRGVVFGWLRGRIPVPAAVVLSAAIFALAHLGWQEWTLLLPVFGIGLVLATLYHYSRSLWPGILVHASINTVATLVVVLGGAHC
jgi:membrane protease YdiL (CAAX protease family)